MTDSVREMNDALTAALSEMPRPSGMEDWQYRDLPKIIEPLFDELIELIGEENISWITRASYVHDGDLYRRGQLWISPAGIQRLKDRPK